MAKELRSGADMRNEISKGVGKLAEVVGASLGPAGRNALISEMGKLKVTNDGVSIARAFALEDQVQNFGAEIVKQSSIKTCDESGDGTTTSCIIANSLIQKGYEAIANGSDPIQLKTGFQKAVTEFNTLLKQHVTTVKNVDQIEKIATISGNNDALIGKRLSDVYKELGFNGTVTLEHGFGPETIVEFHKGYQIDKGYTSSVFVNNEKKQTFECSDGCYVMLFPQGIKSINEILPTLETVRKENKALLIIADDGESIIESMYKVNSERGVSMNICCVRFPGYAEHKIELMDDISRVVLAKLNDAGRLIGECKGVIVSKHSCNIIEGKGSRESIERKVNTIKGQLDNNKPKYHDIQINERIGKLNGSLAIIKVGAGSQIEMNELYDRYDDAVRAVKSALEEGICAGGGHTLLKISSELKMSTSTKDEAIGFQIVKESLLEPLRVLCKNSSKDFKKIYNKMKRPGAPGYNFKKEEYTDLLSDGIVDAVKVVRTAVENAVSISQTLLLCENLIF